MTDAGVALIKRFESCDLTAYQDVRGIWTIGWGHTAGVTRGMVFTQDQADDALLADLSETEAAVARGIGTAATTDNQRGAMVSLCFNIGAAAFAGSTVLRLHRIGAFPAAADAFLMWNKATINGAPREVAGLTRRRHAERALYLTSAIAPA